MLGVFLDVIANGRAMGKRDVAAVQQRESEVPALGRQTSGGAGHADEPAKLAALRDQGVLSDEEFVTQEAKLPSRAPDVRHGL